MKTFAIHYSLTFTNSIDVDADTQEEAVQKFWEIEREKGELDALSGDDGGGYQIVLVEEAATKA